MICCSWCGSPMVPGQPRSRLFATPDGSVRTTSVQAHFHPDCAEELLTSAAENRATNGAVERWTWQYGPRAIGSAF